VALRRQIYDAIREVLARPRDRSAAATEVKSMRARIDAEKGSDDPFDLKHVRGGLIDLEFIAQFLEIASAAEHPQALDQNTELALTKLSAAAVLSSGDAEVLVPAARLSHTLTQVLRLCVDKPFVVGGAPRALQDLLARAADMPDFASLEVTLKNALQNTHDAFIRIVR
jgi:glutamate-ammonia-ligase adenylyltransferase